MTEEIKPLKENDEGTYRGKPVRLLFSANPLPGWIAVEIKCSGNGGQRRTGKRVYIEDISQFDKLVLIPPKRKQNERI